MQKERSQDKEMLKSEKQWEKKNWKDGKNDWDDAAAARERKNWNNLKIQKERKQERKKAKRKKEMK